jgi:hypothetical protein
MWFMSTCSCSETEALECKPQGQREAYVDVTEYLQLLSKTALPFFGIIFNKNQQIQTLK